MEIEGKRPKKCPKCEERRVREDWPGAMAGVVRQRSCALEEFQLHLGEMDGVALQSLNFRELCTKVRARHVRDAKSRTSEDNFLNTRARLEAWSPDELQKHSKLREII